MSGVSKACQATKLKTNVDSHTFPAKAPWSADAMDVILTISKVQVQITKCTKVRPFNKMLTLEGRN